MGDVSESTAEAGESRATRAEPALIRRQAVVVVHGQGQQRPMGTIQDFVKALWVQNRDLDTKPQNVTEIPSASSATNVGRKTWTVPDERGGLFELQRITTPAHPDDESGRKTDFFELYYADLLADTPIRNLWLWGQRLLSIRPQDLTRRMVFPWFVFWMLSVAVAWCIVIVILGLPKLLQADWVDPFLLERSRFWLILIAAAVIGLILRRLLPRQLQDFFRRPLFTLALVGTILVSLFFITWQPPYFVEWRDFVCPELVQKSGTATMLEDPECRALYEETPEGGLPIFPFVMILGVLAYFLMGLILPLFGDAASYLSAQTETVRSRQAVRERGLRLLRALHDDPTYERIVVVAHSLGTALAYDLLHILWQQAGPTSFNPPRTALAALRAVDDHVRDLPKDRRWTDDELFGYRAKQWLAFEALRRLPAVPADQDDERKARPAGWKISDFVSMGAPLTNAQFLVAEGKKDFTRLKQERVLPTSPPEPYDRQRAEKLRKEHEADRRAGRKGAPADLVDAGDGAINDGTMHHASVFGVVRWTNIYDKFHRVFLIPGDIIGGPVAGEHGFGQGILDLDVRVRTSNFPLSERLFTHNSYWYDPEPENEKTAVHLRVLRSAVALFNGDSEARLRAFREEQQAWKKIGLPSTPEDDTEGAAAVDP